MTASRNGINVLAAEAFAVCISNAVVRKKDARRSGDIGAACGALRSGVRRHRKATAAYSYAITQLVALANGQLPGVLTKLTRELLEHGIEVCDEKMLTGPTDDLLPGWVEMRAAMIAQQCALDNCNFFSIKAIDDAG